jgi:hypothetical protein
MKTRNKIISVILCITLLFAAKPLVPAARAQWVDPVGAPAQVWSTTMQTVDRAVAMAEKLVDATASITLVGAKMLALLAVQKATSMLIGDADLMIHDYNNYLYTSPQQLAMARMNSFFNATSQGRLSSANYEGVGPNYDAYLVGQAQQSIAGQPFATNIQSQATDPSSQMFAGGNMKGVMSYMQCANNVACYTLTTSAQYNKELNQAQDVARTSQQGGFVPKKNSNGRIVSPAILAQNALLKVDQMGTDLIMSASAPNFGALPAALTQVAEGAVLSIAGRALNYNIADKGGQQAIRDKNDQFPFSLSYSTKGGMGMGSGTASTSTGLGAIAMPGSRCSGAGGKCGTIGSCTGKTVLAGSNDCLSPSVCCK